VTQADFAWLVGRSEGRVSQLCTDGTLQPGATGLEWLRQFVDRLSSEAAGRHTDGPLDLAQERAALARVQREIGQQRLAQLRGEFAPIELLAEVLATASACVAERLDALPVHLRRRCPGLAADVVAAIGAEIAAARNAWVDATAELVAAKLEDVGDGDEDADAGPAEGQRP
jgi:phage terminase Nu1 subunit (DNA packaging protein)